MGGHYLALKITLAAISYYCFGTDICIHGDTRCAHGRQRQALAAELISRANGAIADAAIEDDKMTAVKLLSMRGGSMIRVDGGEHGNLFIYVAILTRRPSRIIG